MRKKILELPAEFRRITGIIGVQRYISDIVGRQGLGFLIIPSTFVQHLDIKIDTRLLFEFLRPIHVVDTHHFGALINHDGHRIIRSACAFRLAGGQRRQHRDH
ncbi:hypothetical protein [Bifidobacterium amazonense]|uniref:hypothetical protein n=1 Tax=Bifidobacterium amazonense TaxID=2809027 RepID=UPI0030841693